MDPTRLGGWVRDPAAVAQVCGSIPHPRYARAAPPREPASQRTVLLYKAFKEVNGGSYIDYPKQRIGDCVSHSFGSGVDLLSAVQIAVDKVPQTFKQTCTEAIYGMARIDIGGRLGSLDDGAVGAWAAKAVSTVGTISRDVTGPYDGQRAKQWGSQGIPEDVRTAARDHLVKTVSLVSTYQELADALANGYPVTVCSGQGFTLDRDADGFCRPYGTWDHAMLIVGVRAAPRPGACLFQSWGRHIPSGPLSLDQPSNSFWVELSVVEDMLRQGDSWSLSQFDGYPSQVLPAHWSYDGFA